MSVIIEGKAWSSVRFPDIDTARRIKRLARVVLLGTVLVFMLWPYTLVMYQAINDTVAFPTPFRGVTAQWFVRLAEYTPFREGLKTSLAVATSAAILALLIALPGALAIARGPRMLRSGWAEAAASTPMFVPQIAIGLALLQAVTTVGLRLGLTVLVIGHTLLVTPYAARSLVPAARLLPKSLEEVSATLGASRSRTLRTVTLPLLRNSLIAAAMVTFLLSFINLPVSLFLTSAGQKTLPVEVFNYMTSRIDPLVAALAAVFMVVSVAVGFFLLRVLRVRLL